MASIIKIELNLVPGAAPGGIMPRVRVSQGDAQDRILQFELYDGTEVADLTDVVSIFFGGQKPDGNGFTVLCTSQDNLVTGILTPQSTVLAGLIQCKLYLTTATGSVRSATFDMQIDPDPLNDTGTSDTDITAIVAAAGAYAAQAQASAEQAGTIAEETAQAVVDSKLDIVGGDTAQDIVTYTSQDDDTTTDLITDSETTVATMASGETHSSLFNKITGFALNLRRTINAVKAIWSNQAPAWVSGTAYVAGQYVGYLGGIYKCILAHTSSSSILPTNTTYWEAVTIGGELYTQNVNYTNIGTDYTGAWTASSSSAVGTNLSETVTVPAGSYLIIAKYPINASGVPLAYVYIDGAADLTTLLPAISYGTTITKKTFSSQTSVVIKSATEGTSSWSNFERGYLKLIRLQ